MMDSVNSTTFIKRPPFMTDTQEKFLYTKELLSGRIFLGCYREKRYVSVLKDYRDVVVINSEETELQRDLDKIRMKWSGVQGLKWVGITGPEEFGFPKAHCLCVKLTNLALGQYWFQIKHVKLVDQEIVFQLKCIRKSQAPLCAITPEIKERSASYTRKGCEASTSEDESEFDPKKIFSAFQETCIEAVHAIRPHISWRNLFIVIKVGCALVIALVSGIITMIGHIGDYTLKLIRELSILVNAFTPIVIQVIDFLTKIIGGLFILIYGMFRSGNNSNRLQMSKILYRTQTPPMNPSQANVDWRKRNQILRQELLFNSERWK